MIVANLKNGQTKSFDLINPFHREELDRTISNDLVSGLSISCHKTQVSLPIPVRFNNFVFGAELKEHGNKFIECVFVQADNIRVSLTRSLKSNIVKCSVVNIGVLRYSPRRGY